MHILDLQVNINNTVTEDFRYDDDVKSELHQRVRECIDKLNEIVETKETDAKETLVSIRTNKMLEEHVTSLVNEVSIMMQIEMEKLSHNSSNIYQIRSKLDQQLCLTPSKIHLK